jgi:hypothetical protein
MRHVVLLGDSIFDNGPYVDRGESVSEVLSGVLEDKAQVTLLAVDGDCTTDVPKQLQFFPVDATHAFISCGGNDALQVFYKIFGESVSSVGDALGCLVDVREEFRANYRNMLQLALERVDRVAVCTVYNSVPQTNDLPETSASALAALALFNEIIFQEAAALRLPIIDLRSVCVDKGDYSEISPIEPSGVGAKKISNVIKNMLNSHNFEAGLSTVYL